MLKVLAIGNSFSQDSVAQLPALLRAGGEEPTVGNLYIAGCDLERHWQQAESGTADYEFTLNDTGEGLTALSEALAAESWDFVTLQQSSALSGQADSFEPYLSRLLAYAAERCPEAELLLHQTWAYELDSDNEGFVSYGYDQAAMYLAVKEAYAYHARRNKLRQIPCGTAFQLTRATEPFDYAAGRRSLCRDGFHASFTAGRYLLAAVWYEVLSEKSILENSYRPEAMRDDPALTDSEFAALRLSAHLAVNGTN